TASNQMTVGDVLIEGGSGDDSVAYSIGAPVTIEGGSGHMSVVVLGTAGDDNFVVTKDGVSGAGRSVSMTHVQSIEIDGLDGNDHFTVLSTSAGVVTTLVGDGGSDTFDVAGDVATPVLARTTNGEAGYINHSVSSADPAYNGIAVDGVPVMV